ncbi:MAG: hypothetical protein IBX40_12840 [Methanosarcinales archaeon]|nr:hypothetical protein [Methanosarcinales archaeon]
MQSHTNPKRWLPPCYLSVVVAGSAIHGHTLNRQNNRKAPASTPQERAEQIRRGHPGRVKARSRAEEGIAFICGSLRSLPYPGVRGCRRAVWERRCLNVQDGL